MGGAYGSKLNRCAPVAMAAGLAAKQLGRPVRLVLDLATNMQIVGGRSPYRYSYSVPVTRSGKILGIKLRVLNNHVSSCRHTTPVCLSPTSLARLGFPRPCLSYQPGSFGSCTTRGGLSGVEIRWCCGVLGGAVGRVQGAHYDFEYPEMLAFLFFIDNVYNVQTWDVEVKVARTNLPACTWIRAPGHPQPPLCHLTAARNCGPRRLPCTTSRLLPCTTSRLLATGVHCRSWARQRVLRARAQSHAQSCGP